MRFRQALLKVAKEELSAKDFRKVQLATIRPMVLVAVHKEVVFQGVAAGAISPKAGENPGEIDWDALLEFLKELLPLILEFIEALLVLF